MRGLKNIVWVMIIGSAVSRGAFFLAFPFLAVHLKNKFGADLTTIGWVIGAGPLMGAVVGFYGGYLSDILGRRMILICSLIIWGLTQMSFSFANSVFLFGVLSAFNGILRAIAEPVIQAVISDNSQGEARERAYHYRYFAINIGAAIGPVVGAWMLISYPALGFSIAGFSLIVFAFIFAAQKQSHFKILEKTERPPSYWAVMNILRKDKALNYYILASIICGLAYSQTETTLPIILTRTFGNDGIRFLGWTMAVNGITIIIFQLGLNKLTKQYNTVKTVAVSCLVFALGCVGFGFSSDVWWFYIVSMVIFSLGEILVFSNGYILIDRLAPEKLRGTYHSAANLHAIGFAFGPPMGGWVLKHYDQKILFILAALLMVFCCFIYLKGEQVGAEKKL
jgi:MFS family permease